MSATQRKRPDIRRPLMEIFLKRAGQTLYVNDLAHDIGVTEAKILNGIAGIRSNRDKLGVNIEPVIRGRAFVCRPVAKTPPVSTPAPDAPSRPSDSLFRQIGSRKNGALVLERDDGTLWEATEL